MKKLTVWMTTDGTMEVIVAAPTKTAAARLMGRSLYSFNQFASPLYDEHPLAQVALARPGVALHRRNARYYADPAEAWEEA